MTGSLSLLALAMWCVCAGHLTVSLLALIHGHHLSGGRNDRVFGRLAFGMAVSSAGTALLSDAGTVIEGELAQRVQFIGLGAAWIAMLGFERRLFGERAHWVARSRAVGALALIASATGLLTDSNAPLPVAAVGLAVAPHYPTGSVTPLGFVMGGVLTVLLLLAYRLSLPSAATQAGPWLKFAFVSALLVACHDVLVRAGLLRSFYLLDVATLICELSMSLMILHRFGADRAALQQRRTQLEQNYVELRQARDELVRTEQLAALGELSEVVAHEVRNPLAVIRNAAAGLRRRPAPQRRDHLLRLIDEEASRLRELVDGMLVYAKPLRLSRGPYDVCARMAPLVSEVLVSEGRRGEVEYDMHLEGPVLRADGHLLEQALRHVVRNAVQASPHHGTVSVRVQRATLHGEAAVRLVVRDRGPGMDEETRQKARRPFFTTRAKGTGLGLTIADRIVGAHRGELTLEAPEGGGLQVTILLPQDVAGDPESKPAVDRQRSESGAAA